MLPLPGFIRRPVTKLFLKTFIPDTAAYFFNEKLRKEIQSPLRDILGKQEGSITLIAHSQGSIIAHDVLSSLPAGGPDQKIHLITIGSPLGIKEIQENLENMAKDRKPVVPKIVDVWHNFADPLDPVALDKRLGNDFRPYGFIVDQIVVNVRSHFFMAYLSHSAVAYLAHPDVSRVVRHAARVDVHAPFFVARDVVANFPLETRRTHHILQLQVPKKHRKEPLLRNERHQHGGAACLRPARGLSVRPQEILRPPR